MQRFKWNFLIANALMLGALAGANADAQTLYKYVDQDGKVSYSDKAPKAGEKAELVKIDTQTNIVAAPKNTVGGVKQNIQDVNARGKQLEVNREKLLQELDAARDRLALAKKALEDGQEASPDERQIVVRGNQNGIILKEAYYERIAALEAKVKIAEENLETIEQKYRRTAP
jgi:hypothetical protein